jgi:hypothetical protein
MRSRALASALLAALAMLACEAVPMRDDAGHLVDADPMRSDGSQVLPDALVPPEGGPALDPCAPIEGIELGRIPRQGDATDRPPPAHADLNIALRGWSPIDAERNLIELGGDTDVLAPRLYTLFTDDRIPSIVATHRVNNWDWSANAAAGPITESEVSLVSFATAPGEVLEVPWAGREIGLGYQVVVLFVDDDSITLKYTPEDNMVWGYAIHVEGACMDPLLRALYDELDRTGRVELPALRAGAPFARARGGSVDISIRDTGAFMDPRVRKDWWQR